MLLRWSHAVRAAQLKLSSISKSVFSEKSKQWILLYYNPFSFKKNYKLQRAKWEWAKKIIPPQYLWHLTFYNDFEGGEENFIRFQQYTNF